MNELQIDALRQIPGVRGYSRGNERGVICTWDASIAVAYDLGQEPPVPPLMTPVLHEGITRFPNVLPSEFPGLAEYKRKGYSDRLRKHQKQEAAWLAQHSYALYRGIMRSGKSRTATAAATLIEAPRILIIGPAPSRNSWAREIDLCEQEPVTILRGRSADEMHIGAEHIQVQTLQPSEIKTVYSWQGMKRARACPLPARYACKRHGVQAWKPGTCDECRREIQERLRASRWVFANYEILTAQHREDAAGQLFVNHTGAFPGWADAIAEQRFPCVILDEGQAIRGVQQGWKVTEDTRRDRVNKVLEPAIVVWETTGTAMMGRTRELWPQLDAISGGCWGGSFDMDRKIWKRTHFKFEARYCGAGHNGYKGAWVVGDDAQLPNELKARLAYFSVQRLRKEILPELPDKTRELRKIELEGKLPIHASKGEAETRTTRALRQVIKAIAPGEMTDYWLQQLAEGDKLLIFTWRKESTQHLVDVMSKRVASREWKNKLPNPQIWNAEGVTADARDAMCQKFCAHVGCGIMFSTHDAMPGSLTCYSSVEKHPTTTVHHAEPHHKPEAMAQAEDRANDPNKRGGTGLAVIHWMAAGTIVEQLYNKLYAQIEQVATVMGTESALSMQTTMSAAQKTLEDAWASYLATATDLPEGWDPDDD